jgi:hypothetical protein
MPLSCKLENFKERHLPELRAFIPNKLLFVSSPSLGVKHFGWMKNMLLNTPSVGAADIYAVYVILILRA